ncbi:MAG: hypothetical protein ABEJ89_01250 [Haloarculaceae archaeon]
MTRTSEGAPTQRALVERREWDWLLVCDAGRYDVFEAVAGDYLPPDATVEPVHNGGAGFTADWMAATFPGTYDELFAHGGQPIHSMADSEWDERDHFATVPPYDAFAWDETYNTCPPAAVNEVVREHLSDHDRGVVRYLQPHPPLREMPERTRGRATRVRQVANAVRAGDLSLEAVADAYRSNFEWALSEGVADLLPDLEGTVVVTADHGECLGDCGQWFHGRGHDPHDHLVTVPWAVIE